MNNKSKLTIHNFVSQYILGNNTGAAAASILPITNTMTNLGTPLTGSTATGFTIGILKG
jgi:hypothetical protein